VDTTCRLIATHVLLCLQCGSPHGKGSLVVAGFVGSSAGYGEKKATKEKLLLTEVRNALRVQADTRACMAQHRRPTFAEQTEHRDAM